GAHGRVRVLQRGNPAAGQLIRGHRFGTAGGRHEGEQENHAGEEGHAHGGGLRGVDGSEDARTGAGREPDEGKGSTVQFRLAEKKNQGGVCNTAICRREQGGRHGEGVAACLGGGTEYWVLKPGEPAAPAKG